MPYQPRVAILVPAPDYYEKWQPAFARKAAALSAAVGGGVLATTLARSIRRRVLGEADPDMLEHDLAMGGLAIFVRVDDGQEEARALAILREHARNVHVHEVDLAKTLRDIPLGRIRPDPWLDDRPLAAPPNS